MRGLLAALLVVAAGGAAAQAFPFPTRLIADEMSKDLDVAVVAENRAGAGGNLAPEAQSLLAGDTNIMFATFWFGLYVPAGTPSAAVRRLHEAAVKGLGKPEVREKIALQGMDPTPSASPQAFEAEIRKEAPVLEKLIRESGAKVE
jgi:tripartite-type tricarboxylate transporter receptor subunit TctC